MSTLFFAKFFLGHLKISEFLEITFISISKLRKKLQKIFKIFRKFGNTDFDARSIFYQKTKISMEICQRQEDLGSLIISHTSLNVLTNA
jgi:hypothetical protein